MVVATYIFTALTTSQPDQLTHKPKLSCFKHQTLITIYRPISEKFDQHFMSVRMLTWSTAGSLSSITIGPLDERQPTDPR
jgi:hypothetical protein